MIMDCKQFATTKLIIMYCKSAAHTVLSLGAMVACLQGLIGSDDIVMTSLEVELLCLSTTVNSYYRLHVVILRKVQFLYKSLMIRLMGK